jgi:hypothetical protein
VSFLNTRTGHATYFVLRAAKFNQLKIVDAVTKASESANLLTTNETHMASNSKQLARAVAKRARLLEAGALSVPVEKGIGAILLSYNLTSIAEGYRQLHAERLRSLLDYQAELAWQYLEPKIGELAVVHGATDKDVKRVLTDPDYSHMVMVGHGTLSSMYFDTEQNATKRLDWNDLSTMSAHLKTGVFVHWSCTGRYRHLNVPLGTFAVNNLDHVIVPDVREFTPDTIDDPQISTLHPAWHTNEQLTYAHVMQRYGN